MWCLLQPGLAGPRHTMPYLYHGAPGCDLNPNRFSTTLRSHLRRKKHCPCKDVGWTVDMGRRLVPAAEAAQPMEAEPEADELAAGPSDTRTVVDASHTLLSGLNATDGSPVVEIRPSDGYVNATRMCRAAGKDWFNFASNAGTSTFLTALAAAPQLSGMMLVDCQQGGRTPGTWVHPRVAIKLAAWCSPEYEVAVTDLVAWPTAAAESTTVEPAAAVPPLLSALTTIGGHPAVEMRTSDGYVNATRMCRAAGKDWSHFAANAGTSAYLTALSAMIGNPTLPLVHSQHGGRTPGTWVHPQVAIKLAAWCSPGFEVAVTDLVLRYSRGQVTTEESQHVAAGLGAATRTTETDIELTPADDLYSEPVTRGIYLGRPSGTWTQLTASGQDALDLPPGSAVLKFGCSENCSYRVHQHRRAYKGFELLAFQPTADHKLSEDILRNHLRVSDRLMKGLNSNKQSVDTELVLVQNGGELAQLQEFMAKAATPALQDGSLQLRQLELTAAQEVTRQLQLTEPTKQAQEHTRQLELEFQLLRWKRENGLI